MGGGASEASAALVRSDSGVAAEVGRFGGGSAAVRLRIFFLHSAAAASAAASASAGRSGRFSRCRISGGGGFGGGKKKCLHAWGVGRFGGCRIGGGGIGGGWMAGAVGAAGAARPPFVAASAAALGGARRVGYVPLRRLPGGGQCGGSGVERRRLPVGEAVRLKRSGAQASTQGLGIAARGRDRGRSARKAAARDARRSRSGPIRRLSTQARRTDRTTRRPDRSAHSLSGT